MEEGWKFDIDGREESQQWLMRYGNCQFYAGTKAQERAFVGAQDISDLIRDGVNRWQVRIYSFLGGIIVYLR